MAPEIQTINPLRDEADILSVAEHVASHACCRELLEDRIDRLAVAEALAELENAGLIQWDDVRDTLG